MDSTKPETSSSSLFRFEGSQTSVNSRLGEFQSLLGKELSVSFRQQEESSVIWKALSSASPLRKKPVLMKLSVPPSFALQISELLNNIENCKWYSDAAGAWFWLGLENAGASKNIKLIRSSLGIGQASAVLYKAPDEIKDKVGIYSPTQPALKTLQQQLKESFDPANLFNPGRLD